MASRKRPAPLAKGTGPGMDLLAGVSNRDNSETLNRVQQHHLVARYGLDVDRARLVASLVWEVRQ